MSFLFVLGSICFFVGTILNSEGMSAPVWWLWIAGAVYGAVAFWFVVVDRENHR